jgi:hypothetical protein
MAVVTTVFVFGGLAAGSAVGGKLTSKGYAVLGSGLALGITYATSAISGKEDVRDCKQFKEERVKRLNIRNSSDENLKTNPALPSQTSWPD